MAAFPSMVRPEGRGRKGEVEGGAGHCISLAPRHSS